MLDATVENMKEFNHKRDVSVYKSPKLVHQFLFYDETQSVKSMEAMFTHQLLKVCRLSLL